MIRLCREAGLKDPVYESDHGTFSITIYRPKESSTNVQGRNTQPGLGEKLGEKLGERRKAILLRIHENPEINTRELVEKIGISSTAINNNIAWLKKNNYLVREGSDRKGRWIVLKGIDSSDQPPDQDS